MTADTRHRATRMRDQRLWESLMGGQSPHEFAVLCSAATIEAALLDLQRAEHWGAVVSAEAMEGYDLADVLASLARTLQIEGGMQHAERGQQGTGAQEGRNA